MDGRHPKSTPKTAAERHDAWLRISEPMAVDEAPGWDAGLPLVVPVRRRRPSVRRRRAPEPESTSRAGAAVAQPVEGIALPVQDSATRPAAE
jgi:hypothetical protein